MKTVIAAIALCFASVTVHAALPVQPVAQPEFYNLKKFNVNPNSTALPVGKIASGVLAIDKENRSVTVSLQPAWSCPPNAMCAMVMPAPIVIELPLVYEGSGFCGGRILMAEGLYAYDRTLVRIQILDNNGNLCDQNPDPRFQPIEVTVYEYLPGAEAVVSSMSAVPLRR